MLICGILRRCFFVSRLLSGCASRCCAILMGSFFEAAMRDYDFLVADGILPNTWDDHQAVTIRTEFRHRLFPDGKVAGWIVIATIENALLLLRFAFYQVAAAVWAERARFSDHRATIAAFRETRTGDETSKSCRANYQVAPAFRTDFIQLLNGLLHAIHLGLGLFHGHLKIAIEVVQELLPGLSALFHVVEFALHICCEADIDNIWEVFVHDLIDGFSQPGRHKTTLFLLNVATILDGADNGHLGTGSPNTLLFQFFNQTGLGITRRRLRKMLGRLQIMQIQQLVSRKRGQRFLIILVRPDGVKALKFEMRTGGAKDVLGRGNISAHRVENRRCHETGNETPPDQIVKLELVGRQVRPDNLRGQRDICRTNSFMSILRRGFGLAGASWPNIWLPKFPPDIVLDLHLSLL